MSVFQYQLGISASYIALAFGLFYFSYALKYYASSLLALTVFASDPTKLPPESSVAKLLASLEWDQGEEDWVSIQLPFYNELNVARRVLEACLGVDYTNFEVIVADDSRDRTIEVLKEKGWREGRPMVKFVHRKDRSGFKGGALREALRYVHPKSKYVLVFDADFIPPSDIIKRFIACFRLYEGSGKEVAAVQGYQLHFLNRNENWITKGVRSEYSGSYMVERLAEEVVGALKMVSGSVFMFRVDVLRRLGWGDSITEDWDLTVRLYLEGFKVVYTPLIQAPAEIPNTVLRLARQRMRWAEGHTYAVKKYFLRVLRSNKMSLAEKLEFLYFAPYYLQSLFFFIGTSAWAVAQYTKRHPPFWSQTLGWSLVLSNLLAIPIMGLTGLYLEGDLKEDLSGVFAFIPLSYLIMPFQAFAALKGLVEKEEGHWFRTLKTGRITDFFLGVRLRGFIEWVRRIKGLGNRVLEVSPSLPLRETFTAVIAFLVIWPILVLVTSFTPWLNAAQRLAVVRA